MSGAAAFHPILAIFFALAAPSFVSCSKSNGQAPARREEDAVLVTTAKVESVPSDRAIPVWGTLFPKDEATVSAEVEGKVEKTMAEFGDRLKAGQEIAQIDTTSYEAFARQSAANLAKAKASALNAEQNLNRIQELGKEKIASASDLDKAFAEAEQARAEVKAAEATDAIAQLNLRRSHVRTPFDSAVADRIASAGDFMRVGSPLFRLVNDNLLKYIVQAPEGYAGQVKQEQSVLFKVDAYPDQIFEGKVYLISPSVNLATRAFPFGALVQNPDHKLKASSYARGELILERNVPTPMIPIQAVINFAGVSKVFVIENGAARSRTIKVGKIQEGRQEVLSGLKVDEVVVTTGWTKLRDGAKVQIKIQNSEAAKPQAIRSKQFASGYRTA
jgi:membrane fusion protein (multidrug efflux system)